MLRLVRPSQRALAVQPFYAMEFGKRALALEAAGHHVIKLNLGEPDFGAPPAVLSALGKLTDGRPLPYTGATGLIELREAIAGFYRQAHGVEVDPARIIVTAGASAALLLVTAALVDPGDRVLIGDPSYPCNRQFAQGFGAEVVLVPTTPESRFQLDLPAVRANWTEGTRGIMIATPSNPTGTSLGTPELKQICDFAAGNDAWRIVDEIYLNLGTPPATSVLSVDPGAFVINSFSKYFGMTGWRLGWCVVPVDFAPVMERLAQNYYICPSTPAQYAALECFTPQSLAVAEDRREEFARRRAVVLEGLAQAGLPVPVPPDGAFYVYFDVSGTGLGAWEFCERVLAEKHVALTPGKDFGQIGADGYVRLSYAAAVGELREGLSRLAEFTASLNEGR
jgi:aspartate/methionine/tyrosine aminotransferase